MRATRDRCFYCNTGTCSFIIRVGCIDHNLLFPSLYGRKYDAIINLLIQFDHFMTGYHAANMYVTTFMFMQAQQIHV